MNHALIGDAHAEAVDQLLAAFDTVAECGEPRLVVVTGDSGWGRTAVLRAFYARLAAERQGDATAWSVDALDERRDRWFDDRHRIVPTTPKLEAELSWLWWGVSCQRARDTSATANPAVAALDDSRAQLVPIVVRLLAEVLVDEKRRSTLVGLVKLTARLFGGRIVARTVDVFDMMAAGRHAEVGVTLLQSASGLDGGRGGRAYSFLDAIPTGQAATMIQLLRDARALIDRDAAVQSTARSLSDPWLHPAERARQQVAWLDRWLEALNAPLVLVVDNADLADVETEQFIAGILARSGSSVLVAATADGRRLQMQAESDPAGRRFGRTTSGTAWAGKGVVTALRPLGRAELGEVIAARYSAMTSSDVDLVTAAADGNCLHALLLAHSATRRGVVRTTDLPDALHRHLLGDWLELDENAQDALTLAALQGPETVPALLQDFKNELGDEGVPDTDRLSVGLDRAAVAGWIVVLDRDRARFATHAHYLVASAPERATYPDEVMERAPRTLGAVIARWKAHGWDRELTLPARAALYRAHLAIAARDVELDEAELADSADRLAEIELGRGEDELAEAHARLALDIAMRLATEGRIDRLELLVTAGRRYGNLLALNGDLVTAIANARQLVEFARKEGPESEEHAYALWTLAETHEAFSDSQGAIEPARESIRIYTMRRGACDPITLDVRELLARSLRDSEELAAADIEFRALADDLTEARGASDPKTLIAVRRKAECSFMLGQHQAAGDELRSLVAPFNRVFGARSQETFILRFVLAGVAGQDRALDETVDEVRALVWEAQQWMDVEPDVLLRVRFEIGQLLVRADRLAEAIPHLASVLRDASALREGRRYDRLVSDVRFEIGRALFSASQHEDAARVLRPLVEHDRDALPEYSILRLRHAFYFCLALTLCGRPEGIEEGIARLRKVLTTSSEHLGNDHPLTAEIRRSWDRCMQSPAVRFFADIPEPTLSDSDYEEAIRVITNSCRQLERSPSTTLHLDEEERRDLLLAALNAQFKGQAGGEVFNGGGKTDILLVVDGRNLFIAECKMWRGPKAFGRAIDQLLGYLGWRDTKAAIVLFIETRSPTDAISNASTTFAEHPRCVRALGGAMPEERQDFVLRAEEGSVREIRVALLPAVITAPADETG